mmetsp:Transcript_142064/g.247540  ORF Transcript_142064/g.247540 Transcript_142064/m.247540 type:complete len:329 (-) Transcript_142064:1846-2832(-)
MRKRPVFSSFLGHSRTSTTSPACNLRVVSTTFRVAAPISKELVKMVSCTTRNRWPSLTSSRNTVPWLPLMVIHPSALSLQVSARIRSRPDFSSTMGPSTTRTTSLDSSRRMDLLSTALSDVSMASLATFMYFQSKHTNFASVMTPSSSSSRLVKSLSASSEERATVGAEPFWAFCSPFCSSAVACALESASKLLKSASQSLRLKLPFFEATSAKSAAACNFRVCKRFWIAATAFALMPSSSTPSRRRARVCSAVRREDTKFRRPASGESCTSTLRTSMLYQLLRLESTSSSFAAETAFSASFSFSLTLRASPSNSAACESISTAPVSA